MVKWHGHLSDELWCAGKSTHKRRVMTGSGAVMRCDGIDSHCREKPLNDEGFQTVL